MRVLYVYRSPRMAIYQKAISKETPDFPLYGLNHLKELGVRAEFFDEDRSLNGYLRWVQGISRRIINRTQLGWNIGQAIQSLKRIRDYDLVFATTDSTGLPLAFLKRLGLFETPLVIASQGLCQSLQLKEWNWAFRLHRWSLEAVDHVVLYGWAEGKKLHEWFGVPESKLTWLPVGVDVSFFSPETLNAELAAEDVVLSVGRDRCRDYPFLLDVARKLPLRFRIITSRQNLAGTDVPANVEVLFDLPIEEVRRHYASSRLMVLPIKSSSYSFGTTVFFECLSMQKPVIVSRTEAVRYFSEFFPWYNNVHPHTRLEMLTPEQVHSGQGASILARRAEIKAQTLAWRRAYYDALRTGDPDLREEVLIEIDLSDVHTWPCYSWQGPDLPPAKLATPFG